MVVERQVAGAEKAMLGYETLTFAPIDRRLVDVAMLSAEEKAWLDGYHAQVLAKVGPRLDDDARDWLAAACAPIEG